MAASAITPATTPTAMPILPPELRPELEAVGEGELSASEPEVGVEPGTVRTIVEPPTVTYCGTSETLVVSACVAEVGDGEEVKVSDTVVTACVEESTATVEVCDDDESSELDESEPDELEPCTDPTFDCVPVR